MEDEVLRDLSKALLHLEKEFGGGDTLLEQPQTETEEESDSDKQFNQIVPKMYYAVLHLTVVAANCKFVIIDANRNFNDTPEFHFFMDFVKDLGHKV